MGKTPTKTVRKILHIDMDAFYASVEQRDDPSLVNKAVIVGGRPEQRGVVAACSYQARAFGIHSAMPSSRALKLCPDAVFLPPRFTAYREASQQIHAIFREFTALIEPLSLDEAYLDVTELAQHASSATDIAREIKREIQQRVNLTASAGVSYNKFLAKIASDMDKPDGLFVIRPEHAESLIEQLPIRKFHGIGKVTEKKMQRLGIFCGGDLRALSRIQLQTQFGQIGSYYYNISRGIDDRPVTTNQTRKSIGNETTFVDNVSDKKRIWKTLKELTENVAEILQRKELLGRTVTIKVRYADFKIITRSKTLDPAIQSTQNILSVLPELLKKTEVGEKPIRLIGVTLSNLVSNDQTSSKNQTEVREANQLGLFKDS